MPYETIVREQETQYVGNKAYNYLKNIIDRMPEAVKKVALEPALVAGARAQASAIRKEYVQRVGKIKKRVPPKLRSVVYRANKRRGKLFKTIKGGRGKLEYFPSATIRIGGKGARQASNVEYGHKGAFVHGRYKENARVPGKGFVQAGFVGADRRVSKRFEKEVRRRERKIAEESKNLARKSAL